MRSRFGSKFFNLFLLSTISIGADAQVRFQRPFAPTESVVAPIEQPMRQALSLDGSWQFQPVALPRGFQSGIDPVPALPDPTKHDWESTPIKIPSPWNANSFADRHGQGGDFHSFPSYPATWEDVKMGWLRRQFRVPLSWNRENRLLLRFEALAGDARILVNGHEVGHTFDIFFPYEVDITDFVKRDQPNELMVGIRKPELFDRRGRMGRREYQGGSFWGQHVVGIWQDVDLISVPVVRVTHTFVRPEVSRQRLVMEVELQNDGDHQVSVDVDASVRRWISLADQSGDPAAPLWKLSDSSALQVPGRKLTLAAHHQGTLVLETTVNRSLELWSPETPALYGAVVRVRAGQHEIDRKYQRFGWREFKIKGSQLLLNDAPITLKGDSWHFMGIPQMTRRYAMAWFQALHDANLNAVRLHAEPYPQFYLDVADEMGIAVLDETAIWASDGGPKLDSDKFWDDSDRHVAELIMRDRNHPSVFGWSVSNEVKPVIQNVFHGPPSMLETLYRHYTSWAEICHRLDPTRQWISADGDEDAAGRLPVDMIHYGGPDTMARAARLGKPWGVGEASGAYYATPEQAAKFVGEGAYLSFQGRMEGIALEAYRNLTDQKKFGADYRSVFNLVWYGLQPLPLGMSDTTRPPQPTDGIFFPPFKEGERGVQPERLGPYSTTLNPGYDPSLPLYRSWPLFDAIRAANAEPTVPFSIHPKGGTSEEAHPAARIRPDFTVISGPGGTLHSDLERAGLPGPSADQAHVSLLFVDGRTPPGPQSRPAIDKVLAAGGTVVVWGAARESLDQLNRLLPAALELTTRQSSSLVPGTPSPIIDGLNPSDLYFSESSPSLILDGGLAGPLVRRGQVLLEASNTDWLKWNKQAEYAKTAMIVRSEREAKPIGSAVVRVQQGPGELVLINLPAWSSVYKAQLLTRRLLENLGLQLRPQVDIGEPFLKDGTLVRALAAGHFPIQADSTTAPLVNPAQRLHFRDNERIQDLRWVSLAAKDGQFDLGASRLSGSADQSVTYLSFWISSPRALDNLLIEPNIPRLDLVLETEDDVQVLLNGKPIPLHTTARGNVTASSLPLQQSWNHFLVRIVHRSGASHFSAKLTSDTPNYLQQLHSALEKP